VNWWLDLLELLSPEYLCTTVAIYIAIDTLVPPTKGPTMKAIHEYEANLAAKLPALDRNKDGKVDIADVRDVMAELRNQAVTRAAAVQHEVEESPKASAVKALLIGAVLGSIPGVVVGVTVVAPLLR
jgi:hypothetical protein